MQTTLCDQLEQQIDGLHLEPDETGFLRPIPIPIFGEFKNLVYQLIFFFLSDIKQTDFPNICYFVVIYESSLKFDSVVYLVLLSQQVVDYSSSDLQTVQYQHS